MARDREPLTDEDWDAFQRAMDEQREEILQALAEDLGGDPEDYRAGTRRSVDANK
jgi:hypothetical protein